MGVDLVLLPFDPSVLLDTFTAAAGGAGAIVSFIGHARGTNKAGQPLEALVLDIYIGMTLTSMNSIAQDALSRFDITHTHIVHRHGSIKPGEAIVFVATASAHRRAAFLAADYIMDRLKTEAVFWKKEVGPYGEHWIEPTETDHEDRARWQIKQDEDHGRN